MIDFSNTTLYRNGRPVEGFEGVPIEEAIKGAQRGEVVRVPPTYRTLPIDDDARRNVTAKACRVTRAMVDDILTQWEQPVSEKQCGEVYAAVVAAYEAIGMWESIRS